MNFVQEAAMHALRRAGFRVFAPLEPPPVGTVWTPAVGSVLPREVIATTPTHVTYGYGSVQATITVRSWHGWRKQTRAKQNGDAP